MNKYFFNVFSLSFITLIASYSALVAQPVPQQAQQQPANPQAALAAQQNPQLQANLKDSLAAAQAWLKLVDQGQYPQSWDAGALTYQVTITRNEWTKALNLARKPLGSVTSRELIKQDPAENPKNLPAGDYMVIYFKTAFSNRPNAHERVILQKQNSGQWKMLTYDVS
jgi:hypothetical protein